MTGIVVIGAGQAGLSLVVKLRSLGYTGPLTLIGEEGAPPYQRPPLSKAYLMGEMEVERLYLRPESFYHENGIRLLLADTAVSIDRKDKVVVAGGQTIPYDQLALTTGSVPRRLPPAIGGTLGGVYEMRTLADADRLAGEFREGRRVLIIGGGYIGLEAAAVAAKSGMHVTLVEMADRILQRVASPETSAFFRDLHKSHGVDLREGTGLTRLTGDKTVTGAILSDGTELELDLVIVGIGISPATELAEAAGLTVENGIVLDSHGRTSDPSIWAAGDCAVFPYKGEMIRLESVQNAIDQAEIVAENMLGAGKDYVPMPWFWSDQYDVKLQIAGLNRGYDAIHVRPGEREGGISFWYYSGDTLLSVDAINEPRTYMVAKRLIEAGKSPAPSVATDADTDLKALLRA